MPTTIPELWREAVAEVPDRPWLVSEEPTLTYAKADARIRQAARALADLGIGLGDRVVVSAASEPDVLLSWFALMELGAIQVPVNPKSTPVELAGLIGQVEPRLLLGPAGALDGLAEAAVGVAGTLDAVDVADLFASPDRSVAKTGTARGPAADDVAVMIPTSGTTGRSKLVMQTHRAYVMAGEGFPYWMQLGPDDRLLAALPLFHINAPAYSTLGSIAARASLALVPGFSAHRFLDDARLFEATEFNAIGAMLEILMRQPVRPDDADNPIRLCYTGPSPDRERQEEIEARFGFEIVCGYGLSESPYALIWARGTRPYGTLGSARQHPTLGVVNEARVCDDDREVAPGEVGELELRNPAIMAGYYEMPEETAAVVVDGWLRTGDLVRDEGDGTYTFIGRKKEVIRRRGENLSPTEVEAALEHHPAVAEAAVIGVPSELSEEEIKAFVVPADGAAVEEVDLGALRDFVAERLARFKVPRYFEAVAALPHTPTGRLAKHQLPTERTESERDLGEERRG